MNLYLDVDLTLVSLDGQIYNKALIETLKYFNQDGVKIHLLTRMDYSGALSIDQPLRSILISHLRDEGITIERVYTPLDLNTLHSEGQLLEMGDVYALKLKPIEDAFEKLRTSPYFSGADLDAANPELFRQARKNRWTAYRDKPPTRPEIDEISKIAFDEFEQLHNEYKLWRKSLSNTEEYSKHAVYQSLPEGVFIDDSAKERLLFEQEKLPCIAPPKSWQFDAESCYISLPQFILVLADYLQFLPSRNSAFFAFLNNQMESCFNKDPKHAFEIAMFGYICAKEVGSNPELEQQFKDICLNYINGYCDSSLEQYKDCSGYPEPLKSHAEHVVNELIEYQIQCINDGLERQLITVQEDLDEAITRLKTVDLPSAFNSGLRNGIARFYNAALSKSVVNRALDNLFQTIDASFLSAKNASGGVVMDVLDKKITDLLKTSTSNYFKQQFTQRYSALENKFADNMSQDSHSSNSM